MEKETRNFASGGGAIVNDYSTNPTIHEAENVTIYNFEELQETEQLALVLLDKMRADKELSSCEVAIEGKLTVKYCRK